MAPFTGFIGGSYQGRAIAADGERTVNLFPERVESAGAAKSEWVLLSRPGMQPYTTLGDGAPIDALYASNERLFAICGATLWEIVQGHTPVVWNRGAVSVGRAQMVASQSQLLVVTGGQGFIFDLATNALTRITAAGFPASAGKIAFADGYFIASLANSQTFSISGLNDGTSWSALDYGSAQGETGSLCSMIVDHRQLWLLSSTHAEIYYDSGSASFPWTRLDGAFSEQGCAAPDSAAKVDNTIFWLGQNADGAGIVWRANGYKPERVSTHAVEAAMQSYPTIADASAYCYQEGGHTFYRLDFPSANQGLGATWVFDSASGMWHERTYWSNGVEQADLGRRYAFCFGLHLVGDYQSSTIYVQSMDFATDAGAPIRRLRSAPSLSNGGRFTFYSEMRLLMQVGVGLDNDLTPGADPQIVLQVSDDGGFTWGNERSQSFGPLGRFDALVRWRQLGRSRNRVFRVIISDPVTVVIVACDLDSHG